MVGKDDGALQKVRMDGGHTVYGKSVERLRQIGCVSMRPANYMRMCLHDGALVYRVCYAFRGRPRCEDELDSKMDLYFVVRCRVQIEINVFFFAPFCYFICSHMRRAGFSSADRQLDFLPTSIQM